MAKASKSNERSEPLIQMAAGELGGAATTINFTQQIQKEKPNFDSIQTVYEQCRYFARESGFMKEYLRLKAALLNHGRRFVAVEAGKQAAVDKWMMEDAPPLVDNFVDQRTQETVTVESTSTNEEMVNQWVDHAANNFIMFAADIATWIDGVEGATSLQLERVQYTDTMGLEIVRYTHGLSVLQKQQLSKEMQAVFEKPVIILNPKNKIHFKTLKTSGRGEGLPVPQMFSAFRLLGEIESKQFGMNALSFALRSAKRVHRMGYEIKSGQNTGKAISHTLFNTKRANSMKPFWVDKQGFEEYFCNWDEKVEFPWPDPKLFDTLIFKSSNERLVEWGGPIAQMMVAKGVMPYLSNLIKSSVTDDRIKFGTYAGSVITRGFGCPAPVRLEFSNDIFSESRLAAEMVKFGGQNGWLSSSTGTEACGYSPEIEQAKKLLEANDPDAVKKFTPLYAAAQASTPALGETAGGLASAHQTAAPAGGVAPAGKSTKSKGKAPGAMDGRPPGTPNADSTGA